MGKKRVALLVGYVGTKYKGSQLNKEEETVEKKVCDEMAELGYFKERNCEDYTKVGLQRSSRTDKGVHAAMLVLSVKIENREEKDLKDLEETLKENLQKHDIILHRILTTTKTFDAKNRCESRVYEYFVPDSAYISKKDSEGDQGKRHAIFRNVLLQMEGTHNFHNFTASSQERGTSRYIKKITIDRIEEKEKTWNRVTIHGQSFMIHQIRKMIGFAVLSACKTTDTERARLFIEKVFTAEKKNIPKAPGSLLLLSHGLFPNYNEKFGESHAVIDNAGCEEYKTNVLYPVVCTEENEEMFSQWHEVIEKHKEEFEYLEEERDGEMTKEDHKVMTKGKE